VVGVQDCISVKGNSANIDVKNVTCYESGCAVIGSIGKDGTETVDNVVFDGFNCHHSSNAAWIKTYPTQGHVRNVTFKNFIFDDVNQPIFVTPCIYSGTGCDNSRIPIEDITWQNITGTSRYNIAAGMYCPKNAPCKNFKFENINIKPKSGGTAKVLCSNIQNQASMGLKCDGTCPANFPQQLSGNR
jgi:galacturan 1,4-alpha-galacturonidase